MKMGADTVTELWDTVKINMNTVTELRDSERELVESLMVFMTNGTMVTESGTVLMESCGE